ncbi:MAG: hypothetical protein ACW99Q_14730 [Candidatus Kariarchaeaceae archaeon]|jgi:hypothetical protein
MLDLKPFAISCIGGIISISAVLHASFTQILPFSLTPFTMGSILLIMSAFIGLLNEEIKESILAMVITIVGAVFLTAFMRVLPAVLGFIPSQTDVFAFAQVASTLPMFLLMTPFCVFGTMLGLLINEFVVKPRYELA